MSEASAERGRLRYRAERRGLRETELLLGGFFAARGAAMSPKEQEAFAALLASPDPDIWAWVAGGAPAPAEIDMELLADLRAFRLLPKTGE